MTNTQRLQNLIGEILLWQGGRGTVERVMTSATNALPALREAVGLMAQRDEASARGSDRRAP